MEGTNADQLEIPTEELGVQSRQRKSVLRDEKAQSQLRNEESRKMGNSVYPESSHRSSEVRRSVLSLESGSFHRRVPAKTEAGRVQHFVFTSNVDITNREESSHVGPNELHRTPRDSSSLVRDLERDVLLSFDDDDLDGREVLSVGSSMEVDGGSEGVLEEFEDDVGAREGKERPLGKGGELGRTRRVETRSRASWEGGRRGKETHRCPGT